jgi:vacuolar-type H+-ATPase subunit C/Vma6
MPDRGKRAYVYAKACGIIGKSFTGRGLSRLRGLTRLSDLDRLIFPGENRELPGHELLRDLENRITRRTVRQIMSIVASYSRAPELLVRLVRVYEYADVKSLLNHLGSGEPSPLVYTPLKPFGTVAWEAYPDLKAMLRETEFEWIAREAEEALEGKDVLLLLLLEAGIDRQYYRLLWESLRRLAGKDRAAGEFILGEEISLRNCIWALRLRYYYGMGREAGSPFLLDIKLRSGRSTAEDAEKALDFPVDSFAPWESWNRKNFLNPGIPGELWKPDPRYFQNAVSRYLYRLALRSFRRRPFSLDTAFCFIKLKQFEEDLLTSVAEGLGLGMSSGDTLNLLEAGI